MDILNKLSAKQFIVLLLVFGYILFKTDYLHDFLNTIIERFNIVKHLELIEVTKQIQNNIFSNSINTTTSDDENTKPKKPTNLEDSFCNKKKEKFTDYDKKLKCILTNNNISSDILKPINTIPYNYSNNYNNNVLYSISPSYTKTKLKHEKNTNGKILPSNQTPLKTNYNRDIDYYKISKRIDTLQNIEPKLNLNTCTINNRYKLQKELKVFTRENEDNTGILVNWNVPIFPENFFPKEVIVATNNTKESFISRQFDLNKADVYMFDFKTNPCEIIDDMNKFLIKSYTNKDRVVYNLTSINKHWFREQCNAHFVVIKIFFTFQYYNKNKLEDGFIESNISKLMY